ncbi:hypothetical protein GN958_ATG13976, partial [Phytophthora infestans]
SDNVTLEDARMYFDALIDFRSEFSDYLGMLMNMAACVKALGGKIHKLSRAEKSAFAPFGVNEIGASGSAP